MHGAASQGMRSLPPLDYQSLPRLDAPAGYVCVLRDIDSDRYRIDRAAHPAAYIEDLLGEAGRTFGIELIALLEADDLAAAEADLFARYGARLGGDWLELDPYQLAALRQSTLRINAYASQYLRPSPEQASQPATPEAGSLSALLAKPRQPRLRARRRQLRQPLPEVQYGLNALRRQQALRLVDERQARQSPRQRLYRQIDKIFVNHPGIVIMAILLLILIALLAFESMCRFCY